jgi:hypothetical protein
LEQCRNAGRNIDDPPAILKAPRRLAQSIERTPEIDRDLTVEQGILAFGLGGDSPPSVSILATSASAGAALPP